MRILSNFITLLGGLGEAPGVTLRILFNFIALLGGLGEAPGVTLRILSNFISLLGALVGPLGSLWELYLIL